MGGGGGDEWVAAGWQIRRPPIQHIVILTCSACHKLGLYNDAWMDDHWPAIHNAAARRLLTSRRRRACARAYHTHTLAHTQHDARSLIYLRWMNIHPGVIITAIIVRPPPLAPRRVHLHFCYFYLPRNIHKHLLTGRDVMVIASRIAAFNYGVYFGHKQAFLSFEHNIDMQIIV